MALVLLPVAPMELIGSEVETPVPAACPVLGDAVAAAARPAMTVAAVVGLLTMASNILAALLAPLLVARLFVLRRPREHAVSAGWLARGLCRRLSLFPVRCTASPGFHSACDARPVARLLRPRCAAALARLAHVVVATVVRRSKRGRRDRGRRTRRQLWPDPLTQPGARLFVVTALAVGFIFTVISVSINRGPAAKPMLLTQVLGTEYTIMAEFLIVSALIVGADHALRSCARDRRRQGAGLKSVTAVTALVVFLAATWAVDFRYTGLRTTTAWSWAPIASKWERDCAHSGTGEITETVYKRPWTLPCRNITP